MERGVFVKHALASPWRRRVQEANPPASPGGHRNSVKIDAIQT